jgi:hypothetical protein
MNTAKWFTLGAAAALFSATPVLAAEGHGDQHGAMHGDQHGAKHGEQHGAKHGDAHGAAAQPKPNYGKKAKGRKVEVTVTKDGFVPAEIPAKKGEVLNLVVTRRTDRTCATEVVQKDQGIYAPLPLDKPVTVTMKAPKDGKLAFHCAHGHIAGAIVAQ